MGCNGKQDGPDGEWGELLLLHDSNCILCSLTGKQTQVLLQLSFTDVSTQNILMHDIYRGSSTFWYIDVGCLLHNCNFSIFSLRLVTTQRSGLQDINFLLYITFAPPSTTKTISSPCNIQVIRDMNHTKR